jgi:histidine triad (HIT) family protein
MEKLNSDQIKELNEILKIPQDQQQPRLQQFLSTLSDEQIEYLKSQQQQTCPFCSIIFGEIAANKIYEDDKVLVVLDINPGNPGHFISFPKEHIKTSFDMKQEDFMYLMKITNILAKKMTSLLNAEGFNMIISNGFAAGQKSDHFLVHATPRFKDDGINLAWNSKKIDQKTNDFILKEFSNFKVVEEKKQTINGNQEYYYDEERIP